MILKKQVQFIAALSAFLSILFVGWTSHYVIQGAPWAIINTSLGAAAIILFAAPKSEFARPWALMGGQVVAALVGVTTAYLIQNIYLASAVAVAVSIIIMINLRCLFPPAGACALTPILSPETFHALGYFYVLTPVLLNALLICLFSWLVDRLVLDRMVSRKVQSVIDRGLPISEKDIKKAVAGMQTYIDISAEDMLEIYNRAQHHARRRVYREVKPKRLRTKRSRKGVKSE
ncbi:MAG: HPP family protein [Gammaproteobacteria bacterium]|nr:MAG: HPP family protein [Gammaproteobacteria bacterium]